MSFDFEDMTAGALGENGNSKGQVRKKLYARLGLNKLAQGNHRTPRSLKPLLLQGRFKRHSLLAWRAKVTLTGASARVEQKLFGRPKRGGQRDFSHAHSGNQNQFNRGEPL